MPEETPPTSKEDFVASILTTIAEVAHMPLFNLGSGNSLQGLVIPVPKGMKPEKWLPVPEAGTYPDLWWSSKTERSGSDVALKETIFFSRIMGFLVHASIVSSTSPTQDEQADTMIVPRPRHPRKSQ